MSTENYSTQRIARSLGCNIQLHATLAQQLPCTEKDRTEHTVPTSVQKHKWMSSYSATELNLKGTTTASHYLKTGQNNIYNTVPM